MREINRDLEDMGNMAIFRRVTNRVPQNRQNAAPLKANMPSTLFTTEKSIPNPFKEAIARSTAKDMPILRANSFNQKVRTIVMKSELIQTDSFKMIPAPKSEFT